jgi:hypothetical protein
MFFNPPDHVYVAYFNDDAIILNIRTDQYLILPRTLSDSLRTALTRDLQVTDGRYDSVNGELAKLPADFGESIQALVAANILLPQLKVNPGPQSPRHESISGGASNVDWRLSLGDVAGDVGIALIAEAYMTLIKVHFLTKRSGLHGLVRAIRKRATACATVDVEKFRPLVVAVNRASFCFPVRVKCLEWSATLALMALRRTWRCNVEIGVQNAPFAAHAWVKASGQVIADAQELPETLSVILSEPFQWC